MVVCDVVLMASLPSVVGVAPVEEVIDLADKADVIVDRTLVYAERASSPSSRSIPERSG